MTAIIANLGQKWLDSFVLILHKWAKAQEKLTTRDCGTRKIDNLVANTSFRVESEKENRHTHHNTKLLGKFRIRGYKH